MSEQEWTLYQWNFDSPFTWYPLRHVLLILMSEVALNWRVAIKLK